jgi:hypothetical protein
MERDLDNRTRAGHFADLEGPDIGHVLRIASEIREDGKGLVERPMEDADRLEGPPLAAGVAQIPEDDLTPEDEGALFGRQDDFPIWLEASGTGGRRRRRREIGGKCKSQKKCAQ